MTAPAGEWFERWFGQHYLELYPHRNDEEARQGVQTLLELASLESGAAGTCIGVSRMLLVPLGASTRWGISWFSCPVNGKSTKLATTWQGGG